MKNVTKIKNSITNVIRQGSVFIIYWVPQIAMFIPIFIYISFIDNYIQEQGNDAQVFIKIIKLLAAMTAITTTLSGLGFTYTRVLTDTNKVKVKQFSEKLFHASLLLAQAILLISFIMLLKPNPLGKYLNYVFYFISFWVLLTLLTAAVLICESLKIYDVVFNKKYTILYGANILFKFLKSSK